MFENNVKKVLITGGAGFIGTHLTKELVNRGYFVRIIDNLYRSNTEQLKDLIKEGKIEFVEGDIRYLPKVLEVCEGMDYIYHQAADCINKSLKSPLESFDTNIIGTTNVFEAARINKIKKVIFASSASVYGSPEFLPMTENSPLDPITPYCISKLTKEQIAKFYAKFHDVKYIGFRYFNVYGLRQNVDAFYTNVIILFLKRIKKGLAPIIKGKGEQSMDFINVKDIVEANILALEKDVENEIFNLATNQATSISQLAQILLKAIGKEDLKPEFSGETTFAWERRGSYDKAKRFLGWEPKVDITKGLTELAKDIYEHPEFYPDD